MQSPTLFCVSVAGEEKLELQTIISPEEHDTGVYCFSYDTYGALVKAELR